MSTEIILSPAPGRAAGAVRADTESRQARAGIFHGAGQQ
jgi:hypothetical protein